MKKIMFLMALVVLLAAPMGLYAANTSMTIDKMTVESSDSAASDKNTIYDTSCIEKGPTCVHSGTPQRLYSEAPEPQCVCAECGYSCGSGHAKTCSSYSPK